MKVKILDYKEIAYILEKIQNEHYRDSESKYKLLDEIKKDFSETPGTIYYFVDKDGPM
ncbi:hypothetical protein [Clostridium sp.]|uniref:hypothetical protein n=1 Tax=Clostridium sp. TaxID=1506 RepID=UPI001B77D8B2|nr:hypothetical protein [Clostridium sp.]MBP3917395.1 hypothetical protein [Clostridium sp.]